DVVSGNRHDPGDSDRYGHVAFVASAPGSAVDRADENEGEFVMTHESCFAQLDAYLDGELEGGKMHELDLHLRECPSCAAESLRRLQWKRTVHSAGQRFRPE